MNLFQKHKALALTGAALAALWLAGCSREASLTGTAASSASAPVASAVASVGSSAGSSAASSAATSAAVPPEVDARLRQLVRSQLGALGPLQSLRPAPMAGWYELAFDDRVLYADGQGQHLLKGEWIDANTGRNHTQERLDQLQRVSFKTLPFEHAIVMKRGKGTRKMVVFADPLCTYCKHLEQSLGELDDVTIYTFVIPILDEKSVELGQRVLCSPLRLAAWRNWMLQGQLPPQASCDSPLKQLAALGESLRVRVTPTLVFEDGSRVRGAPGLDEIRARLAQAR